MKEYKKPEMNVIKFTVEDIMSISNTDVVSPIDPVNPIPVPTLKPGGPTWEW